MPSPATAWTADLDLLVGAARLAGARALDFFRKGPEVWWKNGGRSPVSAADFAANDILKTELLSARPNYGWLSEETDDDAGRLDCETVFVIDPIDGTRAFIAGKDIWCVSAAVVHRGRPVAGVLFAPSLDELFTASAEGSALKNGTPIAATDADAARLTQMVGTFRLTRDDGGDEDSWDTASPSAAPMAVPAPTRTTAPRPLASAPSRAPALPRS